MATKKDFFVPENARVECRREELSPSGKYKLVITPFSTKKGSWNYSQGLVYEVGSDAPLFEVQRNYSSFPFCWAEDHPNGESYLVCGEDYQGQTVLELGTGKRRDYLPEEAKKGHGFCFSSLEFRREDSLLLVDGCYWACPYEFRLYDFSNPLVALPQIGEKTWIDSDEQRKPTFNEDGTFTVYQTEWNDDDDAYDENDEKKLQPIAATTTYKREGDQLVKVGEWVSEKERDRRDRNEQARLKHEAWYKEFQASDPLYLRALELMKDPVFKPANYNGLGITFNTWCPGFDVQETRICRTLIDEGRKGFNISLEWGAHTGPVKLNMYHKGEKLADEFFMEHSAASIEAAFARAKVLLGGESCQS